MALQRALKSIPLGSQTFSKSYEQFPSEAAPLFLSRGLAGRTWDIDDNEYVDLICGLLPIVLGHQYPRVDEAVVSQLRKGTSLSLATMLEQEVAEKLIAMIPSAEMVRFGKNGTDATSAAVRLARAFTRKDYILALGYHGWQDWYIGATSRSLGVPCSVQNLTRKLPYNDLDALQSAFRSLEGNVAAVVLEPMNSQDPLPGYLEELKELTQKNGSLLIFDEVITGFRFANGGAQEYFGVTPDLAAFGKGMGNGMPISAVVGRADIMSLMNEIFLSSTFGGEALSLAAANAVIDEFNEKPVVKKIWHTGGTIADQTQQLIDQHELSNVIKLTGKNPWKIVQITDHKNGTKEAIKTLFLSEMLKEGVLMAGSHNICFTHTSEDIDRVFKAYKVSLGAVARALESPNLDARLTGPLIKPVFSVR